MIPQLDNEMKMFLQLLLFFLINQIIAYDVTATATATANEPTTSSSSSSSSIITSHSRNEGNKTTLGSLELINKLKDNIQYGEHLKKTAISNKNRLIFVAGLERSGFSMLTTMFEVCINAGTCERPIYLSNLLFSYNKKTKNHEGYFAADDARYAAADTEAIENEMKRLALLSHNENENENENEGNDVHHRLYILDNMPYSMCIDCFLRTKPLEHPDIFALATMAESSGLDFRIIVLLREANEIIHSNGKHFLGGKEFYHIQNKIAIANADSLFGQLMLLEKKFFFCIKKHKFVHMGPSNRDFFMNFIHPTAISNEFDQMMDSIKQFGQDTESREEEERIEQEKNSRPLLNPYAKKYMELQLEARMALLYHRCFLDT